LLVALATIVIDQLSKVAIRRALEMGDQIPLLPGWVHLSHVLNHGAAWGMMAGQRPLLIAIAVGVIAAVVWLAREQVSRGWRPTFGLGLILGGAVGNLIDRILFGAVTDFIDLDTSLSFIRTFPVFNGADSALTIGVILLLWDLMFDRPPSPA
ncbi:MAG: signal peptidase, partial [Abditibacteriota bacterium]|nr:signal peptidase [Abditibacteriota bacterium]